MNREQIIEEVRDGASLALVAKKTGVDRMTISNIVLGAYETGELPIPNHKTVLEGLAQRKKVREYVEERGVFTYAEAEADLGISVPTLNRHLRGLGYSKRTLRKKPKAWRKWSDQDILGALRDVWDEARADGAIYLSVDDYTFRRGDRNLPSSSAITGRFVNWPEACFEAGVPSGSAGAVSRWTTDQHQEALERFYSETGERSMAQYDRWAKGKDVPSAQIIHKHTGSWNDAISWVIEQAYQSSR